MRLCRVCYVVIGVERDDEIENDGCPKRKGCGCECDFVCERVTWGRCGGSRVAMTVGSSLLKGVLHSNATRLISTSLAVQTETLECREESVAGGAWVHVELG
jgi:hypothetical protein